MSNITLSQLSEILDNNFVKELSLIDSTNRPALSWLELNTLPWLVQQKHKLGKKSWKDVPAEEFARYQAGKNVRALFGCSPITEEVLANYLEKLTPWEQGIKNQAKKLALRNMESKLVETTAENKKAALAQAEDIVRANENNRVAEAKNSFKELLELIKGNFGKKAENTDEYQKFFLQIKNDVENRIENALEGAYSTFKRTLPTTARRDKSAELKELIAKTEALFDVFNIDMDIVQNNIAQYAKGIAIFDDIA